MNKILLVAPDKLGLALTCVLSVIQHLFQLQ